MCSLLRTKLALEAFINLEGSMIRAIKSFFKAMLMGALILIALTAIIFAFALHPVVGMVLALLAFGTGYALGFDSANGLKQELQRSTEAVKEFRRREGGSVE